MPPGGGADGWQRISALVVEADTDHVDVCVSGVVVGKRNVAITGIDAPIEKKVSARDGPHGRDLLGEAFCPLVPVRHRRPEAIVFPVTVHFVAEADDRVAEARRDHVSREQNRIGIVIAGRAFGGPVRVVHLDVRYQVLGINELTNRRVGCLPGDKRGARRASDPRVHPVGPSEISVGEGLYAVVGEAGDKFGMAESGTGLVCYAGHLGTTGLRGRAPWVAGMSKRCHRYSRSSDCRACDLRAGDFRRSSKDASRQDDTKS